MPLQEHLLELAAKGLIACRECHSIADVSFNGSCVKLMCPSCHRWLGTWATTSEAAADIAAFIAKKASQQEAHRRGNVSNPCVRFVAGNTATDPLFGSNS